MGLVTALHIANTGLRATQAGIELVSQNVANADSLGYSRRAFSTVESVGGNRVIGVRAGAIERTLDAVAQRQLRLEISGAAYTALGARFAGEVDRLFGTPGAAGSLDGAVNDFTLSLQQLVTEPGSPMARAGVVGAGSVLASRLGLISEGIQALRGDAEAGLEANVSRANDLVSGIAALNGKLAGGAGSSAALLDERDRLIGELAGLVDIQTSKGENGAVNLATTAGFTLVSNTTATTLSFDRRGPVGPQATYSSDPAQRSVGTILARTAGGGTVDLVAANMIRSGEIKAQLDQRDTALVEAQRQLDDLAAGLARALSDRAVPGTPAGAGAATGFDLDLSGLQAGNAITLDYRDNASVPPGAARRVILVPTLGNAPDSIDPLEFGQPGAVVKTVSLSGGMAGLVDSIREALGPGFSVETAPSSPNAVRILDDGAAGAPDLTGLSAVITTTGLTEGDPTLPFFVDSGFGNTPFTGSFEHGSHRTGLAQRLAVNPRLAEDRSRLVIYTTSPPNPSGDSTRPQFLVDALTRADRAFAGTGGQGAYATSVADFARNIVEQQGANAEAAQRLDEGQQVALASIGSRFAESSAVNIDQEMSQLLALQTAFGANARVITAVRDLLDVLMRI